MDNDTVSSSSSSSSSTSSSGNERKRQWGNRNYREKVLGEFRSRKGGNHDQKADIELVRMSTAPSFGQEEKEIKGKEGDHQQQQQQQQQPQSQPLPSRSTPKNKHQQRSSSDSKLIEPSWSRSFSTSESSDMSVEKSGDNDTSMDTLSFQKAVTNNNDVSMDNNDDDDDNTPPTPPINGNKGTLGGASMSIDNDDDDNNNNSDNEARTPILRSPSKNNTSKSRIKVLSPPKNIKSPYEVLTEQNERRIALKEEENKKKSSQQQKLNDVNNNNMQIENNGEKTPELSTPSTPPHSINLSPINRMSSIKSKSRRKSHILANDDDDDDDENVLNFEERKKRIENSKNLRRSNPETPQNGRLATFRNQNILSLPSFSESSSVLYTGSEYDSSAMSSSSSSSSSSPSVSGADSPFTTAPALYRNDNWNGNRRNHERLATVRSTKMASPPSELDSISIDEMSIEQSPQAKTPLQSSSVSSRISTPVGIVIAKSVPSTPMASLTQSSSLSSTKITAKSQKRQVNAKSVLSTPVPTITVKQQDKMRDTPKEPQVVATAKKSVPNTPIQQRPQINLLTANAIIAKKSSPNSSSSSSSSSSQSIDLEAAQLPVVIAADNKKTEISPIAKRDENKKEEKSPIKPITIKTIPSTPDKPARSVSDDKVVKKSVHSTPSSPSKSKKSADKIVMKSVPSTPDKPARSVSDDKVVKKSVHSTPSSPSKAKGSSSPLKTKSDLTSPSKRKSPKKAKPTLSFTTSPIQPVPSTEKKEPDVVNESIEAITSTKNTPGALPRDASIVAQSPPTPPSIYKDDGNDDKDDEEKAFDKEFSTVSIKSVAWPETFATNSEGSPLKHTKTAPVSPMKSSLKKAGSRPSTVKKRVSFTSIDDLPQAVAAAIEEDQKKSKVDTSLSPPSPSKRKTPSRNTASAKADSPVKDEEVKIVKNLSAMFGSDSDDDDDDNVDKKVGKNNFKDDKIISSTPMKRQDMDSSIRLNFDDDDDEDEAEGKEKDNEEEEEENNEDSFIRNASPIKKRRISDANSESVIVEGNEMGEEEEEEEEGGNEGIKGVIRNRVQPTPEKHPLPQLHMSQREAMLTNALDSMPGSSFLDETNDLSVNTSGLLGTSPLMSPQKSVFDSIAAVPGTPISPYRKYLKEAERSMRRSTFSYPKFLSAKQLSDEKAKERNKKKRSNSAAAAAAKKKTVVPPYLRQTFFKSVGRSVTDIPIKTSALAPLAKGSEELLETFILAVNDTARKNGHSEIEFTDVEDVLWLSGLIPTGKSLFDLMRRELPLEALETIFPIAKAHNVILPQYK